MTRSMMLKLAASGLALSVAAIGCTPASRMRPMAASGKASPAAKGALQAASRAQLALAQHRSAVADAEAAVALQPQDARFRMLLGQAYLGAGRFASAEASFADTLALEPGVGRSQLNLALAQVASGHAAAARDTLAAAIGRVPEADRGLALALAGDAPGAVQVLEVVARAPGAVAKTRQNLALAYALAGDWAKARATAAQDMSPADVDARMRDWAAFAVPAAPETQVAALLKVTPAADPGLPTRLALATPAATQVAAAPLPAAEAAPEPEAAPVEVAMAEPTPAEPTPAAEVPFAPPAFSARPVTDPAALLRAPVARVRLADYPLVAAPRRIRQASGSWVVQLGAFSRATPVEAAWSRVRGRVGLLSGYTPSQARFTLASATLTRLTLNGFISRDDAVHVCTRIRTAGGSCFVRAAAGEAPVQMVARGRAVQVAMR